MAILVAEIGWNFIGNINLAKKMIKSAKKSGADFVKFQIWDPKFLKPGPWDTDGRRKIYEKSTLNIDKYKLLKEYSKSQKIKCFASAFNLEGAKFLKKAKDNLIKIPSHEAYNFDLIKYSLKSFNKVIISAGCLKNNELIRLIRFIKKNRIYQKKTLLLHCVSSYPLLAENCNFNKFHFIKRNLGKVGYSGHFHGIEDALYAIFNGAELIEKHFTTNNNLPGRDNKFALNPKQFIKLNEINNLNKKFNFSKGLGIQKCERDIFKNYRGRWSKK